MSIQNSKCEGLLALYSIASRESLDIALVYIKTVTGCTSGPVTFPIVLVGNKCDLPDEERQVSFEGAHYPDALCFDVIIDDMLFKEGQALAQRYQIPFFETSAKNGINIQEPFIQICHEIRRERTVSTPLANPVLGTNLNTLHEQRQNQLQEQRQNQIYAARFPNGLPSEDELQVEGCCSGCIIA